MRPRANLGHRIDVAKDVRDVADRDEPRPPGQLALQIVQPHPAGIIHVHEDRLRAAALRRDPPREQVGVVLGNREDDFVAGAKVRKAPGRGDQVDALGRSTNPDDLVWIPRVDEARDDPSRVYVLVVRASRQRVQRGGGIRVSPA